MEPLMTSDEIAAILKVDVVTIRRLVNRGELTAYKVGSEYRFSRDDLMDFLQRQRVSGEVDEGSLEGEGARSRSVNPKKGLGQRDRFDRFTERARRSLSYAQEEAQRFQHNYIGTEHLLLGLIREGEGVAAKVLANLGIELNKVRGAVEFIVGRGDRIVLSEAGLTPRAKKVIELAADEARRLNHHYIGTEHLLLGLVREGEGIGAKVLDSLGANLDKVRTAVVRIVSVENEQAEQTGEGAQEVKCSQCGTNNAEKFRYCFNCGAALEGQNEESKTDPWTTAAQRYVSGQIVTGVVTRITSFGLFVRIENGIEGLVKQPEFPPDIDPNSVYEGAQLQVRILHIDVERRHLALSLRQIDEPDTTKE